MTDSDRGRDAARATWGAAPAGSAFAPGDAPGTQAFFERVVARRSTYEQPWLADLVPFASFAGKSVIEIGFGAGYDALTIARSGANYVGIDLTPENVVRASAHLAAYQLHPTFLVGDAEHLDFADNSFDVAYSNGVLHHVPDTDQALREIARVLKPGGDAWVIVYHRHSVFHWVTLWAYQHLLRGGFRRRSFEDLLSSIEQDGIHRPIVRAYSRRQLATMLRDAGLEPMGMSVRKLVHEDIPGGPRVLGWVPQAFLDRVAKRLGWYIVAHSRAR